MVYKWYILPIGGIICHRSHLLREPKTNIDHLFAFLFFVPKHPNFPRGSVTNFWDSFNNFFPRKFNIGYQKLMLWKRWTPFKYGHFWYLAVKFLGCTWRIIPLSKWLVTPIYKPFRPFGRGPTTLFRGLTITMVIKHLQVLG